MDIDKGTCPLSALSPGHTPILSVLRGDAVCSVKDFNAASTACRPVFKRVLYTALTPTINMLSVAGLVSIPGMMTGQILAGGDAVVAAKYQVYFPFQPALLINWSACDATEHCPSRGP